METKAEGKLKNKPEKYVSSSNLHSFVSGQKNRRTITLINMKKVLLISFSVILCVFTGLAQSKKQPLVLNNYTIPMNTKGVLIGKVITSGSEAVSLAKDTSKLFVIDKRGNISLKADVELTTQSSYRYEIVVKQGKKTKAFELVKDEFIRNRAVAHRGAWKHSEKSQNSMGSLNKAIELGCEGSELDVWLTKDNVVVLSHDPEIGGKVVDKSTLKEMKTVELKGGEVVPTLEEYLKRIKEQNKTRLVVELKAFSNKAKDGESAALIAERVKRNLQLTDSVVSLIHRMKAQAWCDYISFSYDVMLRLRELDPTAHIAYLSVNKALEEQKIEGISGIDYNLSNFKKDPDLVNKAHKLGLTTNAWTVNKEEDMKYLLDKGIDFVTTDEPELLLKVIAQ